MFERTRSEAEQEKLVRVGFWLFVGLVFILAGARLLAGAMGWIE